MAAQQEEQTDDDTTELLRGLLALSPDIGCKARETYGGFELIDDNSQQFARFFNEHFIKKDRGDDMLFYVTYDDVYGSTDMNSEAGQHQKIKIFRKSHISRPLPKMTDRNINWEETVCLNTIMQVLQYEVIVAIFTRNPHTGRYNAVQKSTRKPIYAAPSYRTLDEKGTGDKISYPEIYFTLDHFDDAFEEFIVKPGQALVVNLYCRLGEDSINLFEGAIDHSGEISSLTKVHAQYDPSRQRGLVSRFTHKRKGTAFVALPGPHIGNHYLTEDLRGKAEIAMMPTDEPRSKSNGWGKYVSWSWWRGKKPSSTHAAVAESEELKQGPPMHAFVTHIYMPWNALLHRVLVSPEPSRLRGFIERLIQHQHQVSTPSSSIPRSSPQPVIETEGNHRIKQDDTSPHESFARQVVASLSLTRTQVVKPSSDKNTFGEETSDI